MKWLVVPKRNGSDSNPPKLEVYWLTLPHDQKNIVRYSFDG